MNLKRYIRNILAVVVMSVATSGLFAQSAFLKQAEDAYSKGNYKEAIKLYEDVLKANGPSADLFYNLGNAYYKANEVAPAILNYERCLKIAPSDADARFNLQMARQKTIDKIEPVGEMFLSKAFSSVQNLFGANGWGAVGIVSFVLLVFCLVMFFFSKLIYLKKIGFYAGLLFVVVIIFANVFGQKQKSKLTVRDEAVVFAPTVTVKSSPDASGNDLFILHEGTKVNIRGKLGEWNEITLDDGSTGWLPSKDIEII
jgi:hypothetical protein